MCNCKSIMKLVIGVLLLVNAFVWPKWLGIDGWISFIAVLMIIGTVVKMIMPACKECSTCCTVPAPKKKKRKR